MTNTVFVKHLPFSSQILIRTRATDLDARMYDGSTALILAARLAVEGMVEELITCHADVNAVDEIGMCTLTCLSLFFPLICNTVNSFMHCIFNTVM